MFGQSSETSWVRRHFEVVVAILLGITAVIGAFSAFKQSNLDSSATVALSKAGQLRTAATGYLSIANQYNLSDQAIMLEYEQAKHTGQPEYAAFIMQRMMNQNIKDTVAWWESHPEVTSPFAEGSPYNQSMYAKAKKTNELADQQMVEYGLYDKKSNGFSKAVTLLAVSLFMFGIAAVVSRHSVRIGASVIGLIVIGLAFVVLFATHAIEI